MTNRWPRAPKLSVDRIRWFASLPWSTPDLARQGTGAGAARAGAAGVMVLAQYRRQVAERSRFRRRSGRRSTARPAGVRPSDGAPGVGEMDIRTYNLVAGDRLHLRYLPGLRPLIYRRVLRPLSEPEADRSAWRRSPALPRRPPRRCASSASTCSRAAPERDGASELHAAHLCRRGHCSVRMR